MQGTEPLSDLPKATQHGTGAARCDGPIMPHEGLEDLPQLFPPSFPQHPTHSPSSRDVAPVWGAQRSGSASAPPAAWAVPPLTRLLPSSTKRFYSRLRAISVHISPEIYSQANIRDPSGGFKRRVLLLLKEGVMDSLGDPPPACVAGRWQHGLAFGGKTGCEAGCGAGTQGRLAEDSDPRVGSALQRAVRGSREEIRGHRLARMGHPLQTPAGRH